ncbi:MAG: hypothetical protein JXR49_10205 [Acidobacteria bacterium]|nr:hypothetical protein [Acidobacteriota bacterium]
MHCERFKEMILDDILEGCDSAKNDELQDHVRACGDCRMEYERMQSLIGIIQPDPEKGLSDFEKLKLENRIYRTRLSRLSSGNRKAFYFKPLAAAAAALLFFLLGFSVRSVHQDDSVIEEMTVADQRIEEFLDRSLPDLSRQRMSPRGLLAMAKGARNALQEYESSRQLP